MVGKFSLITVGLNDQVSTLSTPMQTTWQQRTETPLWNFKQPGRRRRWGRPLQSVWFLGVADVCDHQMT